MAIQPSGAARVKLAAVSEDELDARPHDCYHANLSSNQTPWCKNKLHFPGLLFTFAAVLSQTHELFLMNKSRLIEREG